MSQTKIPRLIEDVSPSPMSFVANTLTVKFACGHTDESISNSWLHTPFVHELAETVPSPQILPVLLSV